MKIECVKEKIQEGISKANKVTGKNLTLPILENIYLETNKDGLLIRATNLDVGTEISIPGKVSKEGSVVVSGNVLHSLIQNISDSKIKLESVEQTLLVSSENTSTTIKTVSGEDFPSIPTVTMKESFSLSLEGFLEGVRSVWYATSVSSMKPELSSVLLTHQEDEIIFVATDSFRLAEKKVVTKKIQKFSDILIPVKNIIDITKILDGLDGELTVKVSEGQVAFEVDGVYVTSRVIDGDFPDYKQIIPKETKTTVTLLKQDLLTGVKTANIFSDKFNKITFNIEPHNKKFYLETKNTDVGENTTVIKANIDGQEISLNFNNKYVVDSLQSIPTDSIKLSFAGEGKPMIIQGVGEKTFLYLAMSMSN